MDDDRRYIHLVIGITGHRDIVKEDRDALKNKIKNVFRELKERFPNTPLLLTPLAKNKVQEHEIVLNIPLSAMMTDSIHTAKLLMLFLR